MKPMPTLDEAEAAVPHDAIEALDVGDLVVLNEDKRTWRVTDAVVQRGEDAPESADERRALRLEAGSEEIFGLVLTREGPTYEAELHPLDTSRWYETDRVFAVEQVERLDTDPYWRVVQSGSPKMYHRPDPVHAARGEAWPACTPLVDVTPDDFRIVPKSINHDGRPCRDCFRRRRVRHPGQVRCPKCEALVAAVQLWGAHVENLDAVEITCPADHCDYQGPVELDQCDSHQTSR